MQSCDDIAEADKDPIAEYLDAIDPENLTATYRNGSGENETKSTNTLRTYVYGLKRVAEVSEKPLVELDADGVNEVMGALRDGRINHESVKDDGYSKSYLKPWQAALRGFYRYHDDLGVDASDIVIFTQDKSTVDERDMYTRDDVQALRDAVENARDRCILELFLNTGQRVRAIQTLRVKDVEPNEGATGVYYLNTDVEGLKGADETGAKRPLLGAQRPVHDWLEYHPKSDDPEAYLITPRQGHAWAEPGDQLSQSTIRKTLRKLADEAGVDKPPNPHNFRHYFVTMCKRHYNMDDGTIKHLIGHGEGSTIMKTTYQHLTDEDHIKDAEVEYGAREPDEEATFTPPNCFTCGASLPPDAKACEPCGAVYAPDAVETQKKLKEQMKEAVQEQKEQADSLEEYRGADTLEEMIEQRVEERVDEKLEEILGDG